VGVASLSGIKGFVKSFFVPKLDKIETFIFSLRFSFLYDKKFFNSFAF